ncbi:MAG: phosphatidate cytidylyltransferase [Proteobacteria bacterium]|nr:phosphatidate cytidylyltransferase [Pseudomonadota bacterium]
MPPADDAAHPLPGATRKDQPAPANKPAASNLVLRVVSAAVMAPLALGFAYWGSWAFALFWAAAGIAVLWEWITLAAGRDHKLILSSCGGAIAVAALLAWRERPVVALLIVALGALAALIFAPRKDRFWVLAGIAYAGTMTLAPIVLRGEGWLGFIAIVLIFAIVWTTDVLAYFTGRAIGGPKLMPKVSPKKTWSGAIGGTIGAVVAAVAVATLFGGLNKVAIGGVALVLSVLSQAGDLLESHVKRHFGAKDASHLIPGHGGVMDRLDGFWAAVVVACMIGLLRGGFEAPARGLLMW